MRLVVLIVMALWAAAVPAQGLDREWRPAIDSGAWRRPLFADNSTVICHAWWTRGGIKDTRGCAWSTAGVVSYVPRAGRRPARSGATTAVNYYSLGTGNDALDFAGDFTCRVVFLGAVGTQILLSNFTANTQGYTTYWVGADFGFATYNGIAGPLTDTGAVVAGTMNVASFGRASGTKYLKVNGRATKSVAGGGIVAGTTSVARLGTDGTNGSPGFYEAWCSSAAFVEATEAAVHATVKSRLGLSW